MPEKSNRPQLPPRLQQLESWTTEGNSSISGEMWEISAPAKNSLSWSIVLSYVICIKKENLQKQFELLLGNKDEMKEVMNKKRISPCAMNYEDITNQIMAFNPFKNRHTFYFNSLIIKVFRIFDLRLNRYANNIQKSEPWGNSRKLEAASRMLQCQIKLYEIDKDGKKTIYSFPNERGISYPNDQIVIFQYSGVAVTENINDVFAFGMPTNHALSLRKKALLHILKVAKLNTTDVNSLLKDFQCDMNFLYFLVKTSKHSAIPILYESPYIPLKLTEAGFNSDPFFVEQPEGPSVFHYCLHPDANDALITLYNYACNNGYKTDETTRNPGSEILSALKSTAMLIQKEFLASDGHRELRSEEITVWLEILRFNKYQCDVVNSILQLRNSTKQLEHTRENLEHTNERIISCIFKLYNEHFLFEEFQSGNNFVYGNFVQYGWYYENIDSFTCLQFFDVLLNLDQYSHLLDTIMALFLTILGYNYLPKCIHAINSTACDLSDIHCGLRFVALNNRQHFLQNTKNLISEFESNSSKRSVAKNKNEKTDENIRKKRVDSIRQKLSCFPELKDQLSIIRLKVIIDSVLNVSLETDGIKGMLTIMRTLQIIGETLCPSPGVECILSCLLSACIPQDLTNQLIATRNNLSHSRPAFVLGRLHFEKNSSLKDLQELISRLNKSFEFVYETQEFRLILMLLVGSKREAENFSRDIWEKLNNWQDSITAAKNRLYQKSHDKFILLIDNVLKFFLENLKRAAYKKAGKCGEITALEFLYNSLSPTFTDRNQLLDAIGDMKAFAEHDELKPECKDDLISILSKQSELIKNTFKLTSPHPSFHYSFSFYDDVRSYRIFSDEDIKKIRAILKTLLEKSSKVKDDLRNCLMEEKSLTSLDEFRELLNLIVMPETKREKMLSFFPKQTLTLKTLNDVKEENIDDMLKMNRDQLTEFLKKEELRRPLTLTDIPASLESKITENLTWRVPFLLSRIDYLEEILIKEDDEINQKWKWGRSTAIKKHTRFLMRTRYIKEREVRASLDMLLFDCHNVLPNREDLKHLWTKVNKLFTGIDLRDVLSHGNIVLQTIGEILDPEDLPTELIDKMLELIEDGDAVRALMELYEKRKPCNQQEFESAVETSGKHMQEKIEKCKEWKSYLSIFALK